MSRVTAIVPLAPVVKTDMRRRVTAAGLTRPECWGARTEDGQWECAREESSGTPWLTFHAPSVADGSCTGPVGLHGSLWACREYIASGAALADLERLQAHGRGEHDSGRDPSCGRC